MPASDGYSHPKWALIGLRTARGRAETRLPVQRLHEQAQPAAQRTDCRKDLMKAPLIVLLLLAVLCFVAMRAGALPCARPKPKRPRWRGRDLPAQGRVPAVSNNLKGVTATQTIQPIRPGSATTTTSTIASAPRRRQPADRCRSSPPIVPSSGRRTVRHRRARSCPDRGSAR